MKGTWCLFSILILARGVYAFSVPAQCGEYKIDGYIVHRSTNYEMVLAPGSMSAVRLNILPTSIPRVQPYVDAAVSVRAVIKHPVSKYRGEVEVREISFRNPYGRSPAEITDGFTLVKEAKCL